MNYLPRLLAGACGAVLAAVSLVPALAQAPPNPPRPAPPALWTVTADIAAPESAFYDAASNSVFVSNINGGVTDKDGNGYISRLTPEGRVVSAKWVTGLNGPKGLRSVGGTLWAADIDEVVGIEIASGRITSRVKIDGATFLNDLATAPDGTVYVSDSQKARIYAVKDGKASIFVEGEDAIETPNGVLVDGSRVIVGSLGLGVFGPPGGRGRGAGAPAGGRLFAFDRATKARTVITPQPVGGTTASSPTAAAATSSPTCSARGCFRWAHPARRAPCWRSRVRVPTSATSRDVESPSCRS